MPDLLNRVTVGLASAASHRYLAPPHHVDIEEEDFVDTDDEDTADDRSTAGRNRYSPTFWSDADIAALKAAIEAEPDLDNICWMNVAKAVTGRNAKQCR